MKKLIFVFALVFSAIPCQARIITVDDNGPADFTNIQAAINDANNGDVVEVQPGTYTGTGNRDIDFKGKAITVRSTDPNDPNVVAATVIDGEIDRNTCYWDCQYGGCDRHRGFKFHSAEGPNSVLAGFTITNFCAPDKLIWGEQMPVGGGILCEGSSPTICQCIITGNTAHILGRGGFGGGIYCDATSNPTITSCTISANDSYFGAGGIECTYVTISDCTITNNSASFGAGGIRCSSAIISRCTISNNYSALAPGGISADSGSIINDCDIRNNAGCNGGGIEGSPAIIRCTITGNSVVCGPGAGIYCTGNATITNCVIANNSAPSGELFEEWVEGVGGGIYCGNNTPTISKCTITANTADAHGGGIYGNPTITNSIVWGNNCPNEPQISGMPNISYSDIQGGWLGIGNINVEPNFADVSSGDYHLKSQAGRWDPNSQTWVIDTNTSPCIDAGNPGCPVGDEPAPNGNRINMGAYSGTSEASKSPENWRSIADLTNNWAVDFNDLKTFVDYWLDAGQCIPADLDRSQSVDFADFAVFTQQWSGTPAAEPGITYQIEDCNQAASGLSAAEQSGQTRFNVTVEGKYIHFQDMMVANCCATELWLEMTVEGNLITICENEEGRFCFCICNYPVTATLGPFEPGTYILNVYEDYGGFIGSTVVTIGAAQ